MLNTLVKFISGAFAFLGIISFSVGQVTTPRPSPMATMSQMIGVTEIKVQYSRPQVVRGGQDRTGEIWGKLVPWGLASNGFGNLQPMPWRAGANENTIISFSTPVLIEGEKLDAGSYGLHMIPYESGKVTIIFSNNITSWGSYWYDEEEDALRVDVQFQGAPFTNLLTYDFISFEGNSGILALRWEKKQVPIKIQVDNEVILSSFRDELRGVQGFGWRGPLSAATYCLNNNITSKEAIQWIDRAIQANRSGLTLGTKAALLFQQGDIDAGEKVADEVVEMATMAELNTLGYQFMSINQYKKAAEFFKVNIERNPETANCYDSMGECYVAMDLKEDAVKMFKKSLSLDPPQFVRNNSISNLKRLGVSEIE